MGSQPLDVATQARAAQIAWAEWQDQKQAVNGEPIRPERVRVLQDGIDLTSKDRNETYGDPLVNLRLQMALWTVYKESAGEKHTFAHDAAMQHVFAKIARIACGKLHRDNYVDGGVYFSIAYECAVREQEQTP